MDKTLLQLLLVGYEVHGEQTNKVSQPALIDVKSAMVTTYFHQRGSSVSESEKYICKIHNDNI